MATANLLLGMPFLYGSESGLNNTSLNNSTYKIVQVFQTAIAGTITRVGFRYSARIGTPPTYKISFQGVDASGNANGTIKGGGSPVSKTFTPPADTTWNGTWRELTFDNAYVCTRGEFLALVIEYSSGTVDGSNYSAITYGWNPEVINLPYSIEIAASTTRQFNIPVFTYGTATNIYGRAMTSNGYSSSSITSTNEAGIRFTIPAICNTLTVLGVRAYLEFAAGKTLTMRLYDGGLDTDTGTILQSVTYDTDVLNSNTNRIMDLYFDETTLSTLIAGNTYRISFSVDSGTNNLNGITVGSAADLEGWSLGTACYKTARTTGNWTDTNTQRPNVGLWIADMSVSGGSAVFNPVGLGSPVIRAA